MKICTITCHNVYNYGARLQAYALAHYLQNHGHDVEVIDYRPYYLRNEVAVWFSPGFSIRQWGKLILQLPERIRAKRRQPFFDTFSRKHIPLTKQTYWSIDELRTNAPEADVYIAGSDQIWNTLFCNGNDAAFYLDFGKKPVKRISYAASFATQHVVDSSKDFVRQKLGLLDAISVREQSAIAILSDLGYKGIQTVDPIFLLTKEEWEKVMDNTGEGERYALVYDFMNSPLVQKEAMRIAKEKGLKLYAIGDQRLWYCNRNYIYAGPDTFLSLIRNASYIVSNSFHGTAFAILFQIPYSVIDREDGLNVRMHDLQQLNADCLHQLQLESMAYLQRHCDTSSSLNNKPRP